MEKYIKYVLRFFQHPIILLVIVSSILFGATLRGSWSNPTPQEIDSSLKVSGQPFETSQERSRWALILSVVYDGTVAIDNYASMGTPDIGQIRGHYYSFFPPTVSIMAIPLYLVGKAVGATQLFVFSLSTLFSLATMVLIVLFSLKLGMPRNVALFSAIAFGFATNGWGYSVTLYAHLVSAFLILASVGIVIFSRSAWLSFVFWLLYGIASFVDFPNIFIFLPIALFHWLQSFRVIQHSKHIQLEIDWLKACMPLVLVVVLAAYGWYNYTLFGHPLTLSNNIPRVHDLGSTVSSTPEKGRDAVSVLNTRNMLEGFYSFLISHDRGVLVYSPVIILAVFGLGYFKNTKKYTELVLITVPVVCLVLYSMFGDPYGGWAFGSRYLIAVMPELCILAGIGLYRFSKNILVKVVYSIVFVYSTCVSLLAPLTTNVIPPFVEARYLGLKSDYTVAIEMLLKDDLNSFFYNHVLNKAISGVWYYTIIASFVVLVGLLLIWITKTHTFAKRGN